MRNKLQEIQKKKSHRRKIWGTFLFLKASHFVVVSSASQVYATPKLLMTETKGK